MHSFRESTWTNRALYGGFGIAALFMLVGWGIETVWLASLLWLGSHMLLSIYPLLTRDTPDTDPERKPVLKNLLLDVGSALIVVVATFAVSLVLGLLIEQTGSSTELPATADFAGAAETDAKTLLYQLLFMAVFIAPWTEEIFFRGFLLNAFRARMPLTWAIAGQAVVFGLMHLAWSPLYAAVTAVMGLGLGLLYVYRDSLRASILAHGMWNGLMALMILASVFTQAHQAMLGVSGESDGDRYVITHIVPSGPAEAAGLEVGDEIVVFDGVEIDTHEQLTREIQAREEGDRVTVEYVRDGQAYEMELLLSTRGEVFE